MWFGIFEPQTCEWDAWLTGKLPAFYVFVIQNGIVNAIQSLKYYLLSSDGTIAPKRHCYLCVDDYRAFG